MTAQGSPDVTPVGVRVEGCGAVTASPPVTAHTPTISSDYGSGQTQSVEPVTGPPPVTGRQLGLTDLERSMRRTGIGGSDIPAICGLSAFRGPLTVYRDKVDGWQQPSNEAMEFGHRFEPMAIDWFIDRTRDLGVIAVTNRQAVAVHPTEPWARVTLDGIVCTDIHHEGAGVIELKSFNVIEDGDVKADVLAQFLWQLWVTGYPTGWVTGLVGHAFQIRQVHAADHADDIAWIVAKARAFWFDHVIAQVPPAPTRADLPMLNGVTVTTAKTVEVDGDIAEAWAERQRLKAEMKALGDRADELEAVVRAAVDDADEATFAGVSILTATETTRRGLNIDAVRAAFPELAACRSFHTESTYRTLRNPPRRTR